MRKVFHPKGKKVSELNAIKQAAYKADREQEARKTAGRKPIADKKQIVTLYVRESIIKELGLEVVKETCYKALNQTF